MWPVFLRYLTRAALVCVLAAVSGCSDGARSASETRPGPFVLSGGRGPATIWAVGDAGHLGHRERSVARLVTKARPDRFLYLGDVYPRGTAKDFEAYDRLFGRLASITAPTAGNHEWPQHLEGYDAYWQRRNGRRPPVHYSFKLAGWEIISLNSQGDGEAASEQMRWLRRKVARPGNCRLSFWHEPRYSAGTVHGDQPDADPLWQSVQDKAAVVVNAHEHHMARMKPRDGIAEYISGAGGHASPYPVRKSDPRLAFADTKHDGALRIRLSPGRAQLAFVAAGGTVLDSSTVRCHSG